MQHVVLLHFKLLEVLLLSLPIYLYILLYLFFYNNMATKNELCNFVSGFLKLCKIQIRVGISKLFILI